MCPDHGSQQLLEENLGFPGCPAAEDHLGKPQALLIFPDKSQPPSPPPPVRIASHGDIVPSKGFGDHILQEFYTLYVTRFRAYIIADLPQDKNLEKCKGPQTDNQLPQNPFTGPFKTKKFCIVFHESYLSTVGGTNMDCTTYILVVRHVTGNDQDYLRKIPRVVVQKSALL
jgi:hypothetical protein